MPPRHPCDVVVLTGAPDFRALARRAPRQGEELWAGYYRKGVAQTSMTYSAAVEETLCLGRIDGTGHRVTTRCGPTRFDPLS